MAVAGDGGIAGRPVIVGHSMGGFVTIATAARPRRPTWPASSSATRRSPSPTPRSASYRLSEAFGRPRTYPTVDDALARFRTVPAAGRTTSTTSSTTSARRSLQAVDGGWQWKFDRAHLRAVRRGHAGDRPAVPRRRVAAGSRCCARSTGSSPTTSAPRCTSALGRVAPVIEIPEAGHHAMLDQPLILLTALRTLLADWDHSVAYRR